MKSRIFTTCVVLVLLEILSVFQKSLPKLSDEQVLNIFGERSWFSRSDEPITIWWETEKCVRALSGLDPDLYQDMSKESFSSFKTQCRQDLLKFIMDPQRNTVDLKLKHMKNPKLAEQITRVRAQSLAAKAEWEKMLREKHEAEVERKNAEQRAEELAKKQEEIAQVKEKAKVLETTLENRLAIIKTKCREWKTTMLDLRERKLIHAINQFEPYACMKNYEKSVRMDAKEILEKISKLEAQPDTYIERYFGHADSSSMDHELEDIEKTIEKIKAEAEETKIELQKTEMKN